MRLSKALKDKLLDVRLRDKLVAEGKISQAEVDNYLKSLNDESGNYEYSVKDDVEEEQDSSEQDSSEQDQIN